MKKKEKCTQNDQLTMKVQVSFVFHSENSLYEQACAFAGASKVQRVLYLTLCVCVNLGDLHSQGQSAACCSLTDRLTKVVTDGQTAGGEGEKGGYCVLHVCLCDSRKLTICGLHDTGVVVVAPGHASHRGHLGPLCVT